MTRSHVIEWGDRRRRRRSPRPTTNDRGNIARSVVARVAVTRFCVTESVVFSYRARRACGGPCPAPNEFIYFFRPTERQQQSRSLRDGGTCAISGRTYYGGFPLAHSRRGRRRRYRGALSFISHMCRRSSNGHVNRRVSISGYAFDNICCSSSVFSFNTQRPPQR